MPFQSIIDDLAEHGWSLQEHFLCDDLAHALATECRKREARGDLAPAGVGRAEALAVREGIRGDFIQWLELGQSAVGDRYLESMESLRQALNREFFLGLDEFECHFAFYPPGAFYKPHLDRFRDDDSRTVTAVAYLNHAWQPEYGGSMRMYLENDETLDIPPLSGSLVVFMSGDMLHEVLPTTQERLSLTGWFRRRSVQVL